MSSLTNVSLGNLECTSGHAFAVDRNGAAYVDQQKKRVGNMLVTSSSPLSNKNAVSYNPSEKTRTIFINSVRSSGLPFGRIIDSDTWIWEWLPTMTIKSIKFQCTPLSTGIQNVVVHCVGKTSEFRFRKVVDKGEAQELLKALEIDIPTLDQVQAYVREAIALSRIIPEPEHASTGYAVKNTMGLVAFYWLRNHKQVLKITTENHLYRFQPISQNLLVTYAIHPNAQNEKVIAMAALLKKQFESILRQEFDAEHVNEHPLKIQEPNTIMSDLPPCLFE